MFIDVTEIIKNAVLKSEEKFDLSEFPFIDMEYRYYEAKEDVLKYNYSYINNDNVNQYRKRLESECTEGISQLSTLVDYNIDFVEEVTYNYNEFHEEVVENYTERYMRDFFKIENDCIFYKIF